MSAIRNGARDFSTVTFKVNMSGSWANLVRVPTERYEEAKAACTALARAADHSVKFKIVDQAGGEIEHYGPTFRGSCISEWQETK